MAVGEQSGFSCPAQYQSRAPDKCQQDVEIKSWRRYLVRTQTTGTQGERRLLRMN